MDARKDGALIAGPASILIIGNDRPLLNWIAYALASVLDPEFRWTDVRMQGEVLAESDPLSREVISADRLSLVRASELAPDHSRANMAVSAVIRGDETPENLRRLLDFLRLPERSQQALSRAVPADRPRVLVMSNAHRLVGYYPVRIVGPLLRAIVASGVIVIMTFADAPTEGRFAFDVVLHLQVHPSGKWRQARLRVEKGLPEGPFRMGSEYGLGDFSRVASVLAERLG